MKNARIFGIVAAPLLLLMGLTATLRLASDHSRPEEAVAEDSQKPAPRRAPMPKPKPVDAATQKELEGIASDQMTAIQQANWAAALKFAIPRYRESMSADGFGKMIEANYREMTRAVKRKFGPAFGASDYVRLPVEITLPDGDQYRMSYELAKQDGSWGIVTCTPASPLMDPRVQRRTADTQY